MHHHHRDHVEMCPKVGAKEAKCLADLAVGQSGTVMALVGGHGFVGRMAALGFTPGAEVSVVRNSGRGPLIVAVLDTHIALGRRQAMQVYIRANGGLQ